MKKEKDKGRKAMLPIWHKANLALSEAAKYSNIGKNSIVELIESGSTHFSFRVGNKRLINRELFEEFIKEGCRIGFNLKAISALLDRHVCFATPGGFVLKPNGNQTNLAAKNSRMHIAAIPKCIFSQKASLELIVKTMNLENSIAKPLPVTHVTSGRGL